MAETCLADSHDDRLIAFSFPPLYFVALFHAMGDYIYRALGVDICIYNYIIYICQSVSRP